MCTTGLYGHVSFPAVLTQCVSTATVTVIDNMGFGTASVFGSPLGSLVYAANSSNVGMTIDITFFFNITANTSYVQFNFFLNGTAKAPTAQIIGTAKGMVN